MAGPLERLIRDGLRSLQIDAPDESLVNRSAAFLELIARWNRIYNLTAIAKPLDMVGVHLMDSFAIAPHIKGQTILDVGSGAGLPGIPLALLFPGKDFILLDSSSRKTRFMTQARIELSLNNVTVAHRRVEEHSGPVDLVVCRAYASLDRIVSATRHLLEPGGSILAMKGAAREPMSAADFQREDITLEVPLVEGRRRLAALTFLGA